MAVTAVGVGRGGPSDAVGDPQADAQRAGGATAGYSKVLVIVEENETQDGVIGNPRAPYLTKLAKTYGYASRLDAGYPAKCPSLAAYILLTSGDDRGICDDKRPAAHPIAGPSVFSQVTAAGKQWRLYGEAMPANCAQSNDGLFAVRHAPANYYTDLRAECLRQSVPLGTVERGALREDVEAGALPELVFVIPHLCHDMHGAKTCRDGVRAGDDWARELVPVLQNGPDYRAGRLAIVFAWDEGTKKNNHIPLVVVSPTTSTVVVEAPATLCSVLATMSAVLAVEPLGCAAGAESLAEEFGLLPG